MIILTGVGRWYQQQNRQPKKVAAAAVSPVPQGRVVSTLALLVSLMFSKFFYLTSINSFLIFYLMHQYGISTKLSGRIGDPIGRKRVIWVSILGIAPFALALPYVGLQASVPLTVIIGFMLASAFPAMVVYAQELIPGKIGMISGLFFGLAFGLAGIGAAVLGQAADHWGIVEIYKICSFLPLIGLLAVFLPDLHGVAIAKTADLATPAAN